MKKRTIKKIILSVLIAVIIIGFAAYIICLQAPKEYLSEKYNVPKSEFTAVFLSPKKHEKETALFWDECEYDYWVPTQWTIEYYDGYYVDDYQLDDLWKWCVDYLQKNIDPNIDGIQLYETDLYYSIKNDYGSRIHSEKQYYSKVWTEDDVELFLRQKAGVPVYYKVNKINEYTYEVPTGYRMNDKYYLLADGLTEKASTLLQKDFSLRPNLHEDDFYYRRRNTYIKFGISNYASTYGINEMKEEYYYE